MELKVRLPTPVEPQVGTIFFVKDGPHSNYPLGSPKQKRLSEAMKGLLLQLAEHPAMRKHLETYGRKFTHDSEGFLIVKKRDDASHWAELTLAVFRDRELRLLFDLWGLAVREF